MFTKELSEVWGKGDVGRDRTRLSETRVQRHTNTKCALKTGRTFSFNKRCVREKTYTLTGGINVKLAD